MKLKVAKEEEKYKASVNMTSWNFSTIKTATRIEEAVQWILFYNTAYKV